MREQNRYQWGAVPHICNPSTQAEAEGLPQVQDQSELRNKTLYFDRLLIVLG